MFIRYIKEPVNCDCDLQWLLEWLQASNKHEVVGDCKRPDGFVRLSELRIEDLDCQGTAIVKRNHIHNQIAAAAVKPEFSIHAPAGVSLLCLVPSQWHISLNAQFWWKKVSHCLVDTFHFTA